MYPGFSLHKELQLLKECGIPDAEVFKMATVNAVQFLKLENEYGAVKPGLNASLILLTANPLEDISNTQKIESVFVKGNRVDKINWILWLRSKGWNLITREAPIGASLVI